MKFPGQRKSKHYFPVKKRDPLLAQFIQQPQPISTYVSGIDQTLVDIEAKVEDELLSRYELPKGNSTLIDDDKAHALYTELKERELVSDEFAGGTIGNTVHNYSILADDRSVLFGVMSQNIEIGSYAYRYLCNTSSKVDLNQLQPVAGPIGRCFTLISECGERTFAISKGSMDKLTPEYIDRDIVQGGSALILTAYLMRASGEDKITDAAMKAIEYAKAAEVPVVLTLGTRFLIEEDPQWWQRFIQEHVSILAMNEDEGEALTGFKDPLQASQTALDWCDMVLTTAGPLGLYTAGYTEDSEKRETTHTLLPGAIPEFNRYEFSRPKLKADCESPLKVYAHISPYMGGPEKIRNTNGAGDGALAALLHDLASNRFHKMNVPGSSKHKRDGLCYSSFSQICKYANRVAYEVLAQHSPRLSRGLPEREDSLEESYWER
ncbi:inosine/guanosine kinase [Shewanella sp. Choline-02u-19]|uniref:inosine/guanosine kinase n=1 Tax=unclassified Shewanella TaxID=196818 RepID=UPI000C33DC27|nr:MULTISPECIES: inosine/guanosine kinase [unclassified Shewanella]PKG56361.1 inosine/guanosine kinase [Shewanella sp. GutDb-MelDb]PKG73372.1 inosine/guanosine kinase [Shewanella sp. GutCb]PKH59160.1 inosine/guanosine kinase [Shewanella sp. Bg11-22]PKI27035.1 inosine/guanosine kinase [Shewanella sp. Choline-02u-19]